MIVTPARKPLPTPFSRRWAPRRCSDGDLQRFSKADRRSRGHYGQALTVYVCGAGRHSPITGGLTRGSTASGLLASKEIQIIPSETRYPSVACLADRTGASLCLKSLACFCAVEHLLLCGGRSGGRPQDLR